MHEKLEFNALDNRTAVVHLHMAVLCCQQRFTGA
jgi:hypothetical protein